MIAESKERQLQIADRCDRCGAQAFVIVRGVTGDLFFCGHDFTKNEKALKDFAFEIIDERSYINEHSSSSV